MPRLTPFARAVSPPSPACSARTSPAPRSRPGPLLALSPAAAGVDRLSLDNCSQRAYIQARGTARSRRVHAPRTPRNCHGARLHVHAPTSACLHGGWRVLRAQVHDNGCLDVRLRPAPCLQLHSKDLTLSTMRCAIRTVVPRDAGVRSAILHSGWVRALSLRCAESWNSGLNLESSAWSCAFAAVLWM
ncbi:hypothetical protein HYPSUDRAFT_1014247 [Hypholoma sublateritium FD-334 SS-4]|uniref:Uncharacterized protein n=1 Tax=Hypholoma sublateritium (strain FD-334 SS-4) TaxID=945553 RepID=A0A0D2PB13_HYPSF|nr:hypothetical protein HYPSUDRAFT_1014247 [Hypholoma sublateritium FD-334 SS-4]